ncbi:hypothetical protein EGI26_04510 [Lacihabitans sp. CCS-44]|nr:hypothetical protein [Lacihabitans sp. CCS-44]
MKKNTTQLNLFDSESSNIKENSSSQSSIHNIPLNRTKVIDFLPKNHLTLNEKYKIILELSAHL